MKIALTILLALTLPGVTHAEPKARTIEITPDRVLVGSTLFRVCAPCHGPEGEGRPGMAARLTSRTYLEAASDEALIKTIAEGRAGTAMVSWRDILTRSQMESIVAYLRQQVPTRPATLDESPRTGDAANGARLFKARCNTCHDPAGARFRQWGTRVTGRPFLSQVSDGYLRYIIAKGKSGTAMQAFAGGAPLPELHLEPKQIEDVIAWLRENAR